MIRPLPGSPLFPYTTLFRSGVQLECFLKVRNRFRGSPFPRGQKAEIVPGVWQSVGIARMKFDRALKSLPRFTRLLLLQVDASQAVESLGARGIVAKRKPE